MQLKDIKRVVKAMGHAILLEENGSGLVVLALDDYLKLAGLEAGEEIVVKRASLENNGFSGENEANWRVPMSSEQDLLLVEKLNQDIALLKEEIKKRELEELESGLEAERIDPVRDVQK